MSIQIIYTDIFGSPITEQQQNMPHDFKKMTFISNNIKTIEIFENVGEISYKSAKYFIDATENKQDLIRKYVDATANSSLMIYSNKVQANGFDLWDWESYEKSSQISFKGKEVFDNKLRTIFTCAFDISTNSLLKGARKFYYENQVSNAVDDLLLKITYNANGCVNLIFDANENFGYTKAISLATFLDDTDFSQEVFPWNEHPYYHSVLPYLPSGSL